MLVPNSVIVYSGGGKSERLLWLWFEAEVNCLCEEGMVDSKMTVFSNEQTTTTSVVATLANVYRFRRRGYCTPTDVQ